MGQGELRGRIKVYADEMHLTVEEIAERLHMDKESIEEILDEIN
jgi:plasmid maintenance system antidote protein VapI